MISDTPSENHNPQSIEHRGSKEGKVTVEDVNRVLEVGRLLFSVLTDELTFIIDRFILKNKKNPEFNNYFKTT